MAISLNGTTGVDTPGLVVDTDTLYIDRVNNRVGIGTNSPVGYLTVERNDPEDDTPFLYIHNTADNDGKLWFNSNRSGEDNTIGHIQWQWNGNRISEIRAVTGNETVDKNNGSLFLFGESNIVFTTNNDDARMVIDNAGNVGIGTSSPTEKFEIKPNASADSRIYVFDYDTGSGGGNRNTGLLTENFSNNGYGDGYYCYYSRGTRTSKSAVQTNDVTGYFVWGGYSGNAYIQSAFIGGYVDGPVTTSSVPLAIDFHTGTTDSSPSRMVIDSAGNVVIGSPGVSGGKALFLYSDTISNGQNAGIGCEAQTGTTNWRGAYIFVEKHSGITNPVGVLELSAEDAAVNYLWADNSDQLRISTTRTHIGTTSGTVAGAQTSDERLKNISGPVEYGILEIMALEPIAFTMKDDESETPKIGFSAQQVLPIIPESVFDTNIEIEEGQPTKLGMEYVSLIPVLVKAIQEQQEIIQSLSARIEALENA